VAEDDAIEVRLPDGDTTAQRDVSLSTVQGRREFARQVRPARIAARMTSEELADAVGVHRNTITGLETGAHVPKREVLVSVLDVLGILPGSDVQTTPEVERWLRIMAPLVSVLPDGRRQALMLEMIERLADEVGRTVVPPS
jgi:DNA-binding XRE family transcriptional regulator